jgi:Asp-tRNA(Asn)/Glu-tRNA(Gln) amidotransferase A subunit family amidase
LKVAAGSAVATALAPSDLLGQTLPTSRHGDSSASGNPTTRTSAPTTRAPQPPLGNAESPALVFQPYPGGTGAWFEKLIAQRGAAAFARSPIDVQPWSGDVPSSEEELAFLPVHRLAALIGAGKVSPVDLTRIYLDRLKKLDPTLLCAVTIMEDRAHEAAQQAEREIRAGHYRGPLHGIPWGVKDLFATRGVPTTWGANELQSRVIDDDAEVVRRLTEAGAILIAKLATGRFAMGDRWYRGMTRNPWNPAAGSSGSSAGPASAVAAGCVAFAIGTETRGSIVSPAARCGIGALRPTFGRVSRAGGMVLAWSMDRVGPMCRSAEDCAIVFNTIHGSDEKDPSTVTVPFQFARNLPAAELGKLRIGYDRRVPADFVAKLKELGANPQSIGNRPMISGLETIDPESASAFRGDLSSGVLEDVDNPNGGTGAGRFTNGRKMSAVDFLDVQRRREILIHRMAEFFKDYDLYISGSGENGGDVELCSLTGHPAAILPCSFGSTGTAPPQPHTTTIIGDLYGDDRILSVASTYQQATDFHLRRPSLGA